jgi:sugar/nucleoside kinase (ribokinase family)
MSKRILGIGNAIVDVFVKVDDSFLSKNNLTKGSMKLIENNEFLINGDSNAAIIFDAPVISPVGSAIACKFKIKHP